MTHDGNKLSRPQAKELFFGLLQERPPEAVIEESRLFLSHQLEKVAHESADIPAEKSELTQWMKANTISVGEQYRDYLNGRQDGEDRRYFPTKSHALHFLKAVAPTKLVDGAWLYGLVTQWRDARYAELIRIYLEELGEGEPEKNHVLLYKKLLHTHGCTDWQSLDEAHFVTGAIQLALGQHASEFLPEIIGYNLGYEQLPLHLLICAHELNELGIDPYYFTLHVTVDNAATGHAAKSVQAVSDAMPNLGDREAFYKRICEGYKLNSLGVGTTEAIANFNLGAEVHNILGAKALTGGPLHSDYCRIAGKTVHEWLANPEKIQDFLQALQQTGWIRRHEPACKSRFWNLLVGKKGVMFGVFNAYELQVLYDWIVGASQKELRKVPPVFTRHEVDEGPIARNSWRSIKRSAQEAPSGAARERENDSGGKAVSWDFAAESEALKEIVAKAPDKASAMDLLVPWLSPVYHHTAVGLLATRMFTQGLRT